jgi:hypothetical protein
MQASMAMTLFLRVTRRYMFTLCVMSSKTDVTSKVRLIGDGHLTDIPVESVYSRVISLHGLQMVTFLAELNGMDLWATDIGNAYLQAFTAKKLVIVSGPEFREMEGHILIISKALYRLRTSGLCWHDCFSKCLCKMGFTPSKAKPDIWMWHNNDYYESIMVFVDDLAIALKDPKDITDTLMGTYGFKLDGSY